MVEQHCFGMFRSNKRVWNYIFTFDGNTYLLLWKSIFTFNGNTQLLIWKYIFTFGSPGRSPSSFIVFWPSGLQWPKRNRWPFLRAYRHRTTFVPISHQPAMMMIPSKTRTRINLYWFCTATADRWKNNLVKYETSHIFF